MCQNGAWQVRLGKTFLWSVRCSDIVLMKPNISNILNKKLNYKTRIKNRIIISGRHTSRIQQRPQQCSLHIWDSEVMSRVPGEGQNLSWGSKAEEPASQRQQRMQSWSLQLWDLEAMQAALKNLRQGDSSTHSSQLRNSRMGHRKHHTIITTMGKQCRHPLCLENEDCSSDESKSIKHPFSLSVKYFREEI